MRILMLNYEYPPIGGGASAQTRLLANSFQSLGHTVYIITTYYKGERFYQKTEGISIYRIPVFRKYEYQSRKIEMLLFVLLGCILSIFISLRKKIQIQLAFFLLPTGIIAWLNRLISRVPYIISLRGGDVPSFVPDEISYNKMWLNLALCIGKKAAVIDTVSNDLAELAKADFPLLKNKIINIDNGIDTSAGYSPRSRNDVTVFMYAGRITQQKNLHNIVISLSTTEKPFILKIFGNGPMKHEIEQLVKELKLNKKVIFYQWKSVQEIEKEMLKSDYLILLSKKEGLSMASLQAYKNGLPIVASKVCGLQNFVINKHSGFLVDIDKSDDYSSVFAEAIGFSEWETMSANCRTLAVEKYNITSKANEYLRLMDEYKQNKRYKRDI